MTTHNVHGSRSSFRFRTWVLWGCLLCFLPFQMGCLNNILLLGYLIGGPPSIEPDFDSQTKKSFTGKGKKVVVLCYASDKVKWDYSKIDRELAAHVSYRLRDHRVHVIDPDAVNGWIDQNPDWTKPEELGADAEADFVVYVEIQEFSLYEEHSSNLYRGRTKALVSVYEMDGDQGEVIYSKDIDSKYPLHQPVATSERPEYAFKQLYMTRLSEEVGRLFYEHYAGDDIPDGALSE
ncbi:MAG: hypothetical protein U0903_21720 [Planctomycetales bacterium]